MASRLTGEKLTIMGAAWVGAILLVLQAHRLPGNFSHAVCGPWGCGPPLPSLIAMHGFWLVGLSLPVVLCGRLLTPHRLMAVSAVILVLSLAGIAGVVVWQFEHWLPAASEMQREYLLQRCVFAVVTLTDAPLVQGLLAGIAGGITAWFRLPKSSPAVVPATAHHTTAVAR